MNITCYGYYNKSNLGDDLIMKALKCLFSEWSKRSGEYVNLSFMHNSLKSNGNYIGLLHYFLGHRPDAVILGSGGLFPKNRIRNFVKFLIIGTRCRNNVFLGVGVDPLLRYQSAYKRIFEKTKFNIFRDQGSLKNIIALTQDVQTIERSSVMSDLVIALKDSLFPYNSISTSYSFREDKVWIICKNDPDVRHFNFYKELIKLLLAQRKKVCFIAFGKNDLIYSSKFERMGAESVLADISNVFEIFCSIKDLDVVISERYHGIILSLIFKKRFVPLCYDYKHQYLLDDIGFNGKRHLINYDEKGHLSQLLEANVNEVLDDVIAIGERDFGDYFLKVEEMSKAAYKGYMSALDALAEGIR